MSMQIEKIIKCIEKIAPPAWQEAYDNCGLLTGQPGWVCTGVICSLDVTEAVVQEAKTKGCNLIVAHHPIIFTGLKKINGNNYIERTIIAAIKNEIAIYAVHTNLDNTIDGVNKEIANRLGLQDCRILAPKTGLLKKIYYFTPAAFAEKVREALFNAGAGNIGPYKECSFSTEGTGTFNGDTTTHPFAGTPGIRHSEKEIKAEMVFPAFLEKKLIAALIASHPYEEVAYDIISLSNNYQYSGSGMIGYLPEAMSEPAFFSFLKKTFELKLIRHTLLLNKTIKKVAVCGGAGSFLLPDAKAAGADVYITADMKYHEFFDADNQLIMADIGHWESEQFTIDLLFDILNTNFPTFAVLKTEVITNPVNYFL